MPDGPDAGAVSPASSEQAGRRRIAEPPSVRAVLRAVAVVVGAALALYLVYLLRTPISYLVVATFVAVAVAGPVNALSRHMSKGFAIAIVYVGIVLAPLGIAAILVPPAVEAGIDLVNNLPGYVREAEATVDNSSTLSEVNQKFDVTQKLSELSRDAVNSLDDAAVELANIGAGFVGFLFGLLMILVMSIFMVARGAGWVEAILRTRPKKEAESISRALNAMAFAVGSYIGGAIAQAVIAGTGAFVMLTILGVDAPLALAVLVALFDLIPLVGATIGAVLVGVVTLFADFPTATIIWAVFAIVYQQFENYVVQPRIQSRAVDLDPFIIVIAALFGGTLFGIAGALLAIPSAAALQIAVHEFLAFRREGGTAGEPGPAAGPVAPGKTAQA